MKERVQNAEAFIYEARRGTKGGMSREREGGVTDSVTGGASAGNTLALHKWVKSLGLKILE